MPGKIFGLKTAEGVEGKVQRLLLLCGVITIVVVLQGLVIGGLRAKSGNSRVASDSAMVKIMYGLSLPLIGTFITKAEKARAMNISIRERLTPDVSFSVLRRICRSQITFEYNNWMLYGM